MDDFVCLKSYKEKKDKRNIYALNNIHQYNLSWAKNTWMIFMMRL